MKQKTHLIAAVLVAFFVSSNFFSAACAPVNSVALTSTSEPTSTATPAGTPTATPTATPSPTPNPTPSPTPMPINEKIKMMEVYKDQRPNAFCPVNMLLFVHYEIGNEEKIAIVLVGGIIDPTNGGEEIVMINVIDNNTLIYYNENIIDNRGPDGVDWYSGVLPYPEGYKDKTLKLKYIGNLDEFENYLEELGITVPETEYSSRISDPDAKGGLTRFEFAEYAAVVIPDNLYPFPQELLPHNENSTSSPAQ